MRRIGQLCQKSKYCVNPSKENQTVLKVTDNAEISLLKISDHDQIKTLYPPIVSSQIRRLTTNYGYKMAIWTTAEKKNYSMLPSSPPPPPSPQIQKLHVNLPDLTSCNGPNALVTKFITIAFPWVCVAILASLHTCIATLATSSILTSILFHQSFLQFLRLLFLRLSSISKQMLIDYSSSVFHFSSQLALPIEEDPRVWMQDQAPSIQ